MTEAMPFLRKLITFLWPPDICPGVFPLMKERYLFYPMAK